MKIFLNPSRSQLTPGHTLIEAEARDGSDHTMFATVATSDTIAARNAFTASMPKWAITRAKVIEGSEPDQEGISGEDFNGASPSVELQEPPSLSESIESLQRTEEWIRSLAAQVISPIRMRDEIDGHADTCREAAEKLKLFREAARP